MKIRAILENISSQQRAVGQLPADFRPPQTSPQLNGPYAGRNATRGYLVGENQDMAEGHADQQRKIFKRNGQPVGEVGIDRESSPGVGQYYMKHYASGTDLSGYNSREEAMDELRHVMKQSIYGELREQGVAEGQAGKEDLRKIIVDILERIYFDASSDDDMTDVIADQLGDYYRAVKVSGDAVLKRAYADMRDTADAPPAEQATVALAGIQKLMGPGYRPQPRPPLSPEQNAQVDAFVNQFKAALASQGIRAHPDWNKDKKPGQGVAEGVDIGQEWMSDTELDQYVPDDLQQEWRELVGYDEAGNVHPLWANITGDYAPDASDPEHRAWMVKVANKWFAMKRIPNVRFFAVRDRDDELEWLVQIGEQDVREGTDFFDRFGLPIMPDDDGKFQDMMRGIKRGTKKQARTDRRERDAASRERARAAFGPSPADKLSIRRDQGVAESGWNPLDDERREQRRMDAERREFKRRELEAELGGEEQRAQQIMRGTWYIVIDGQVWKRQGQPVTFTGREAARRAGQTIKNRTPERTVTITTKLPTTENSTRDRVAQMRAQTQDRLQTMRANAQAGRDRLRGRTQTPATRKTNAAGVTQHDWMAQAQKQGARLIQSKMIDGPVIAIYSDGRRDAWQPVGESVSESVKQHHFIYETHERMFEEKYNREKEREEWAARKAQYVQQAMDRDEKRREYEREKKEKEAQAHQHSTTGQEEFVAPHGDARNEVAMFQAGTKPAALINPPDVGIWSDLINSGRYVLQQLKLSGQPDGYVIGQPGEEERVEKIHALVQNANDRAQQGDFSPFQNSNYHRWLGRLLGYPASKIEQFITNYFRDTPDRARARYDEDADFHRGRQPGVRYVIRDAQGRVLSTHDDIDSARDELQGIEDRAGYRIVQTRRPAGSWNITEEPLDMDLIKRAQGGMAGTNQDPDSERFRDQPYGYRDRAQKTFDPMARLDKGSVNSIERALGIKWPKHRAWQGTVKVDESRDQHYLRVFREAVASGITSEDVLTTMKRRLGDYLQDVATAIRKDPDLVKKIPQARDQIGPAVRTLKTDDGHEIRIHGNEDDGFRVSIRNRNIPSKFRSLDEAEIATEMYCARRKQAAQLRDDYRDEA